MNRWMAWAAGIAVGGGLVQGYHSVMTARLARMFAGTVVIDQYSSSLGGHAPDGGTVCRELPHYGDAADTRGLVDCRGFLPGGGGRIVATYQRVRRQRFTWTAAEDDAGGGSNETLYYDDADAGISAHDWITKP